MVEMLLAIGAGVVCRAADPVSAVRETRAPAVRASVHPMSRPRRADAAIAAGLYAIVLAEVVASEFETDAALLLGAGLVLTLPLVWRRAAPLPAVVVSMAGAVALALLTRRDVEPQTPIVVMLVAAYSAGAHLRRNEALAGLALVVAAILVDEPGDAIVLGPVCLGAWLAGRLWQARERDARRMAELAEALDRERAEEGRIAVAWERARIARELHDVVAHAMTTIVLAAGAERLHLEPGQERTGEALRGIERTGRQALDEMRRLLGVLRADDDEPALAPQPRLARLVELVEHLGRTGLVVDLRVVGTPTELSPGLEVNAYRIVQEALTNVLKHAAADSATVVIDYQAAMLAIEVTDDGRGDARNGAGGHGLTGLRERVALYGGELEAGECPGGGFAVRARLPLEDAPP
jgi:signal transduction histidine kinase